MVFSVKEVAIIITGMRKGRRVSLIITGLISVLTAALVAQVSAASDNVSRSYKTEKLIDPASIVSLHAKQLDFVEPSNLENAVRLIGVIVGGQDSIVAIDEAKGEDQAQVATDGVVSVIVSSLTGDIKIGDQVVVSPFDGVGMKGSAGGYIVGKAQTDFNARTAGTITQNVTDRDGQRQRIRLGFIRLNVGISASPQVADAQLSALQRFAKTITGKSVSNLRVVLSIIIIGVAFIALVTLIYSAIYGSIISVGRNPLGAPAIYRTLASVMLMAAMTAILAAVAVFFLMR